MPRGIRGMPLLVSAHVRASPGSSGRPSAGGLGGTRAGTAPGRQNRLRYKLGAPSHCVSEAPRGVPLPPQVWLSFGREQGDPGALSSREENSPQWKRGTFSTRVSPHANRYHIMSRVPDGLSAERDKSLVTVNNGASSRRNTNISHLHHLGPSTEGASTMLPKSCHSSPTNLSLGMDATVPSPGANPWAVSCSSPTFPTRRARCPYMLPVAPSCRCWRRTGVSPSSAFRMSSLQGCQLSTTTAEILQSPKQERP